MEEKSALKFVHLFKGDPQRGGVPNETQRCVEVHDQNPAEGVWSTAGASQYCTPNGRWL